MALNLARAPACLCLSCAAFAASLAPWRHSMDFRLWPSRKVTRLPRGARPIFEPAYKPAQRADFWLTGGYSHASANNIGDYRVWPGPNSNTFVAAIIAAVSGMRAALPSTAICKDFPFDRRWIGWTPSRTGIRVNLRGYLSFSYRVGRGAGDKRSGGRRWHRHATAGAQTPRHWRLGMLTAVAPQPDSVTARSP